MVTGINIDSLTKQIVSMILPIWKNSGSKGKDLIALRMTSCSTLDFAEDLKPVPSIETITALHQNTRILILNATWENSQTKESSTILQQPSTIQRMSVQTLQTVGQMFPLFTSHLAETKVPKNYR